MPRSRETPGPWRVLDSETNENEHGPTALASGNVIAVAGYFGRLVVVVCGLEMGTRKPNRHPDIQGGHHLEDDANLAARGTWCRSPRAQPHVRQYFRSVRDAGILHDDRTNT